MGQWIAATPNPASPRVIPQVRMFGILATWLEADIVAAAIRNAMTQGCERVYLVDNASPDDTVGIALAEGAILGRTYSTERYDEHLRLSHMNSVVREVSESEGDKHIWWLYLDADEFPHGPWGMTLAEYLRTLDQRFRVVGMRCFDHYPSGDPSYMPGRHPLEFQPLCEELAYPMCPSRHRKHSLQRFDRDGPPITCGHGFHKAHCEELLHEPSQPAFLHHFPFRDEKVTRTRLASLWGLDEAGAARALETDVATTHMYARLRSLDAVYSQNWECVENFIARTPMYKHLDQPPSTSGVTLKPWRDQVEPAHQNVLRWYSPANAWKYQDLKKFRYGDDTSYKNGIAYLDGHGTIEDWGCGFAHAKSFVERSQYIGIDGSSPHADMIADLENYSSNVDCIFMRHVLEHNVHWSRILSSAIKSFKIRMTLVLFTPFSESTRVIATPNAVTSFPVPDIAFKREDLINHFSHLHYREESLRTNTKYGCEYIFYIEK